MSGITAQSLKDSIKEKLATALKENLKIEEKEFSNPWSNQDKAAVMQSTRCFSETPIDAVKCVELLTRIVYLLQSGEKFTAEEMTKLFFDVTKLFQCPNTRLRRMVYLVTKELEPSEQEVFMIMSCLIKDMNSKNDCFRANSIRVLSRILDPAMAAQIDRYLKTAIVDKNPFVASSALVCGVNLTRTVPEVVKRWVNETQETVQSKHQMVQFHAIALIYELKKSDRLALHKVVTGLAKGGQLKSAMAECLLVRYAAQILTSERDPAVEKTLMQFLDMCLRNKNEMVTYEAARALCQLAAQDTEGSGQTVLGYDISHVTTNLQIFLTSPKPVIRFGAIKMLNRLAQQRPQLAARCNCDMDPLLSDQNRNTATLALTTLLKTGHESNVDRLVKQITSFMSDISDAFKIEVVRAVRQLCFQYPSKYKTLMAFLASNLREDGTAEFKKDLVDSIILIIGQVPAAREVGLLHLCEFIEDCEYPNLCARILAFLGEEVPNAPTPSKHIRFIYNRLILENALVRAAAVDALTKIAMNDKCKELRKDVLVLLQYGQNDNDDEVRDRISLYSTVLRKCVEEDASQKEALSPVMSTDMPFSMSALYDGLLEHITSDAQDEPFSIESLPTEEAYQSQLRAQAAVTETTTKKKPNAAPGAAPAPAETAKQVAEAKAVTNEALNKIIEELGGDFGPLQHSCKPKNLTESEAEYTVQVIKHMYREHVVLEMSVSNTVQGYTLENVEVKLAGIAPNWSHVGDTTIPKLENGQTASAYVVLAKVDKDNLVGSFGTTLRFLVKEEGDDLGYDDDYPVENCTITVGDYMFPKGMPPGQFKSVWDQLQNSGVETQKDMALNFKNVELAIDGIISTLNMQPCENSGKVEAGSKGHTLLMTGVFLGGNTALVKCMVRVHEEKGLLARIACRSRQQIVCDVVAKAML
jgi:coatomer protein complex subunit gamma|mmetsp:Transcript_66883/g.105815  ORF Transcript_66883/g.105815 Transcript_66883/m.105815 type:complete len:925 (-) Transcript_66883:200-2974(-)|eukprot:CAMPEP_0169106302 /NCGR_PEP_ID=MMETSP1015-20121227/24264_1 /TAXON_ID=342587 /ORGANISM="Karlodinium micrum, Strain CCMP2283" /LENGTH=924 /DNA_ID=CAMNT_0009167733 /DNA_START=83 /DNA_END=2857 /DNA_ORIENTATION=+